MFLLEDSKIVKYVHGHDVGVVLVLQCSYEVVRAPENGGDDPAFGPSIDL